MASLFQWPFKRKQYPGLENPRFVSDIVAANQAVLDGLMYISGLNATDFAIIWGIEYDQVALNYQAGIFYLQGSFYYMPQVFAAGLYLTPDVQDTLIKPFGDGVG